MSSKLLISLTIAGLLPCVPGTQGEAFDGSDLRKDALEREQEVNKLSLDERLKVRAAQKDAIQDPKVQEALKTRNEAIQQFRIALREAMLRSDPSLQSIINKILPIKPATDTNP